MGQAIAGFSNQLQLRPDLRILTMPCDCWSAAHGSGVDRRAVSREKNLKCACWAEGANWAGTTRMADRCWKNGPARRIPDTRTSSAIPAASGSAILNGAGPAELFLGRRGSDAAGEVRPRSPRSDALRPDADAREKPTIFPIATAPWPSAWERFPCLPRIRAGTFPLITGARTSVVDLLGISRPAPRAYDMMLDGAPSWRARPMAPRTVMFTSIT